MPTIRARHGRQSGQALVAALVTMVLLFSLAGGLIFAVSSLLDHQINTGNLFVADFGAQAPISAGTSYVAGHGLFTGTPSLCPTSRALPGLGSGGEISGVWCRQIDNIVPGTPAIARLAWAGSCSVTAVNGAGGRHVLLWFSAIGATSAYVDGSVSGCSGGSPRCSASGGGDPAQLALDCDLSGLGAPYLHISNAARAAGSFRFAQYAPPFVLATGSPLAVGNTPDAMAVADLNGDGLSDLAVLNRSSDSVSVLLGKPGGLFASAINLPSGGPDPVAIAIADVNRDGRSDLIILTQDDQSVHVLLGNGDGTFQPARNAVSTPSHPVAMVAADFNGDGRTDLAVLGGTGSNQLAILLGNGDGTFTPASGSPITLGGNGAGVVAADLNGDGKADLAITESAPNQVETFLGRGDGTFARGSWIGVGLSPRPIVASDLNGDRLTDLVVGNRDDGTLSVLLGRGDGSFTPAPGSPIIVGGTPAAIAIADFNRDGRPDVAVANSAAGSVTVLYGAGDGSLASPSSLTVGTSPVALVAGDLDADGAADFAVANSGSANVTVYRGNTNRASLFMLGAPAPAGATVQLEEGDVVVSADGRSTILAFEGAV